VDPFIVNHNESAAES